MTRTLQPCKILWFIWFAVLMLFGCRSSAPPVQFYTLSATRAPTQASSTTAGKPVSVGVGPVSIPQMLNRPQIVIRTSPHKLQIDEFHRWAGRLDEIIARAVAENIALMLPTEQVAVYPWDASFKPNYQLILDIRHFEGRRGQGVYLEVFWKVIDPRNKTVVQAKKSVIKEAVADGAVDTLIAAKSRAIESVSDIIVNKIKKLNK